jgi:hypothetical protein
MIFYKLSTKHKRLFILNQVILFFALIVAFAVAINKSELELPTNALKLKASAGFVMASIILALAFMNRLGVLFKIKSMGFVILFLFFTFLQTINLAIVWTTGLMLIPLLIDDIVIRPMWLNLWYNVYDK